MTTRREFEAQTREERLATLRFVQDRDGIDPPLYVALATQHEWLLNRANKVSLRRPLCYQENRTPWLNILGHTNFRKVWRKPAAVQKAQETKSAKHS